MNDKHKINVTKCLVFLSFVATFCRYIPLHNNLKLLFD